MHIVYVCADPDVPVFGTTAASLHVQEVVRVMAAEHRVSVIAASTGDLVPQDLAGLDVRALPAVTGGDAAQREQSSRVAAASVPQLIADAERTHGPADLIYERYSLWSTGGMRAAAARGAPGVLEVNAALIDQQAELHQLGDRAGAEKVARTAFGDASVVIAVADPIAEWVRDRTPSPARVHVVANGVDPRRFRPRSTRSRRPFTVGFVGSLEPAQGADLLIAALCALGDDTRLLVVGDGPELQHLRAAAEPLGERAVFTGALLPDAVPTALAQMDVTVAPYPPGVTHLSPLKVLEYMAAETAVIGSAVGQIPSLIDHGRTGLLVPPGDVPALTAAIARLRDEPMLRRALGAEARRVVIERHTWSKVVSRIFALAEVGPMRIVTLPGHADVRLP